MTAIISLFHSHLLPLTLSEAPISVITVEDAPWDAHRHDHDLHHFGAVTAIHHSNNHNHHSHHHHIHPLADAFTMSYHGHHHGGHHGHH